MPTLSALDSKLNNFSLCLESHEIDGTEYFIVGNRGLP